MNIDARDTVFTLRIFMRILEDIDIGVCLRWRFE